MEILDEYPLPCGEGKHIKAFSQIVKGLSLSSLEEGETQGLILGNHITSLNRWHQSKNKNLVTWAKEKTESLEAYISAFPELSWPMGPIIEHKVPKALRRNDK